MLRLFFKDGYRSLTSDKLNSLLKIAGLSVGIFSFTTISLYVFNETNYNHYFKNVSRIYRVAMDLTSLGNNSVQQIAWSDAALGDKLSENTTVVATVRVIHPQNQITVEINGRKFKEETFYRAEHTFFEVFEHKWIRGDPQNALSQPNSIILTEQISKKYFNDVDALNQSILINGENYLISGVIEDLPHNTDLHFDALLSFDQPIASALDWCYTFVLLKSRSSAEAFQRSLDQIFAKQIRPILQETNSDGTYILESLETLHFGTPKLYDFPKANKSNLTSLQIIGFLVLILSAINYINITTAQSVRRQINIGMRKLLGAGFSHIQAQFLGESLISCIISLAMSMLLVTLSMPFISQLAGKQLSLWQASPMFYFELLFYILIVGVAAGYYPAVRFFLTRAISNIKGESKLGRRTLRNTLVIIQFTASVSLIVATATVGQQLKVLTDVVPGYSENQMIIINLPQDESLESSLPLLKSSIAELSSVESVSFIGQDALPTSSMNVDTYEVNQNESSTKLFSTIHVDENYLDLLEIEFIEGRNFNSPDDDQSVIINKAAVNSLDIGSPLDKKIYSGSLAYNVIGVVDNFNDKGRNKNPDPLLIFLNKGASDKLVVKLSRVDHEAVRLIKDAWQHIIPDHPFDFRFMDYYFEKQYETEMVLRSLLKYFTSLAIIISCIGLFGLVSIDAVQKTKELTIRKVFGANGLQVVILVFKNYFLLILISTFISVPFVYWILELWLEGFSKKTAVNPTTFLLAYFFISVVSIFALSYHIYNLARKSSVENLKVY